MAEKIELLISAKNAADAALKDARTEVRNLERQVRKATDALEDTGEGRRDLDRLVEKLGEARVEAKRWALVQKDATQELEKTGNAAKSAGRKFDGMNRQQSRSARGGSAFVAGWGKVAGVAAAVTGAIAGLSGAFNFLAGSVQEARAARKAAAQTAAVMRSMGRTEAPKAVNKMIDQLSRISGIDDDALREMTNIMFTFGNVTGDTFTRANQLALDLSVAFGKDLSSSAVMVGKALNDPTKGLTALSRVGVSFTKEQQAQVKAMMEVGNLAGAQKIIMRELTKQVGGSAKAQADGLDKTQVAWGNLKEAIGDTLMSAVQGSGMDLVGMLEDATRWLKKNKATIVSILQKVISIVFKVISLWLKWQSIALKAFGYIIGGIASLLTAMSWLDPSLKGAAENARGLANGFGEASEAANTASTYFDGLANKTGKAAEKTKALDDALKGLKKRQKTKVVVDVVTNITSSLFDLGAGSVGAPVDDTGGGRKRRKKRGDTAVPHARGTLPHSLAHAHAALGSGIPGSRTITSALRYDHLGSPGSDHARGRALDLSGPGLNAYAARVRAGGGYAAFHGSGPDRHLHAVPGAGGVTEVHNHYSATVHNPSSNVDVRAVFRQMIVEHERDIRTRGGGWRG